MIIVIDRNTSVTNDADGNIYVTRPNMKGNLVTHKLATKQYTALDVALWLSTRRGLVQDIFPDMSADDREFLLSGITPAEWAAMFPKEDN